MKHFLLSAFLLVFCTFSWSQNTYTTTLEKERAIHSEQFPKAILNESEQKLFAGICYFPIDSTYIIEAQFIREKGKKFIMPMSKERIVYYRKYGRIEFTLHDTLCVLNVYENLSLKGNPEYKNYLFLPFKDGTTAISTYGGGRYLDIQKSKSTRWKIDFNRAYHPYCAYSERYSCPIVPKENSLQVVLPVGECYVPHEE